MDGYNWETYIELRKPEYLGNLATEDWSEGKETWRHTKKIVNAELLVSSQSEYFVYRNNTKIYKRWTITGTVHDMYRKQDGYAHERQSSDGILDVRASLYGLFSILYICASA